MPHSVLLVDDNEQALDELVGALRLRLPETEAEIKTWVPTQSDADPMGVFLEKLGANTTLVVADQDLSGRGLTGLFGSSLVAWCQERAIPVGDFSRLRNTSLPTQPEFFELRVPAHSEKAAPFIAAVFRGFRHISEAIDGSDRFVRMRSPAEVLAGILEVPDAESQFSLYDLRFGAASAALMAQVVNTAAPDQRASDEQKRRLLAYIVGHLLLSVLRFPGPILSGRALRAYIAGDDAEAGDIEKLFAPAAYRGPFSQLESFFWLSGVDAVLDPLLPDAQTETIGELHRLGVESRLAHPLGRHACPRCHGINGGFFCPFTVATVCQRPDCSVGSNSWIPQGARLCRIEREFFDEWAPVLGL